MGSPNFGVSVLSSRRAKKKGRAASEENQSSGMENKLYKNIKINLIFETISVIFY
jgi:hypothetical protein